MRTERGGSISTETTNRPSASARAQPASAGAPASGRPSAAAAVVSRWVRAGAVAAASAAAAASVPGATTDRASIAARIAAMCSGVVPQQPPTIRAPASSMSPTIPPK